MEKEQSETKQGVFMRPGVSINDRNARKNNRKKLGKCGTNLRI